MYYVKDSIEYGLIKEFYGTDCANRSGVPLINHIDEGLAILEWLGASRAAMGGYCLHPMVQNEIDHNDNIDSLEAIPEIECSLELALRYRQFANAYLCRPGTDTWDIPVIRRVLVNAAGLMNKQVNYMLIADKVQNQKDFLKYHYGTHARSEQLKKYFENWLVVLDYQTEVDRRSGKLVIFEDGVDWQC